MSNLDAAIQQAISICWDETIGYRLGGMAQSSADGVDCSGHERVAFLAACADEQRLFGLFCEFYRRALNDFAVDYG